MGIKPTALSDDELKDESSACVFRDSVPHKSLNSNYIDNMPAAKCSRHIVYYADYQIVARHANPETSLPKLFAYVGYNQRTTAVRNFQKITGVTPAEFIESIKQ